MRLSVLVSNEMPLTCNFFEVTFPFVEHEIFDVLGPLPHLCKFSIDLNHFDGKLALSNDRY